MEIGKWKVLVQRQPGRLGGAVIIWRKNNNKAEVMHCNQEGESTTELIDLGQDFKPTMYIYDEEVLRGVLAAFTATAGEFGIKAPDQSFAEGKLEAVTDHLTDMRKLVFDRIEVTGVEKKR